MSTYTTNYNLEKPEASDPFGDFRESYNDNLDIIDANLGGGGGSSSLAGLSDVDLTTPTDGQVLTYDGINSKWVNANGGGGGGDTVSWTQIQASGTKIAEIDINGTSQDVYAPSGGGGGDYYYPIIYSETERQIGVWLDNKPLYKKTWDFGSAGMSINAQTWVNTAILKDDFDMIVGVEGENGDGAVWDILGARGRSSSSAYVQIYSTRNSSITVRYLTLYYTKISDIAGSGNWNNEGVPTVHYTLTEQVVGTWLGKPLYQITIPFSGINTYANTWYAFNISSYLTNPEIVFNISDMDYYFVSGVQRMFSNTSYEPPNMLLQTNVNRTNISGHVTVRYTKTTD